MPWPTVTDYNEAIQNLRATVVDEELRQGTVSRAGRLPAKWPGNFAVVYQVKCPQTGNTWAVKCFTRKTPNRQERYRAISDCLQQTHLRSTVGFQYLEQGIRVRDEWFPVLKMKWVEGKPLNEFVEEHLDDQQILGQFLQLWPLLARELREAGIAHADLQHGNVLLVPRDDGKHSLKLVDYDGMYLPTLAGTPSGEYGHANYQHPRRLEQHVYSGEVDHFSHLVIFTAVWCLASGHLELWQRFDNGENLLFGQSDFQDPRCSQIFQSLWQSPGTNVRALVGQLVLACVQPLEATPRLDDILDGGNVRPLSEKQVREIESMLRTPVSPKRVADTASLGGLDPKHILEVPYVAVAPAPRSDEGEPVSSARGAAEPRASVILARRYGGRRISTHLLPLAVATLGRSSERDICLRIEPTDIPANRDRTFQISARQCVLRYLGDRVEVIDTQSTNGTIVRSVGRLRPGIAATVSDGDIITVGDALNLQVEFGWRSNPLRIDGETAWQIEQHKDDVEWLNECLVGPGKPGNLNYIRLRRLDNLVEEEYVLLLGKGIVGHFGNPLIPLEGRAAEISGVVPADSGSTADCSAELYWDGRRFHLRSHVSGQVHVGGTAVPAEQSQQLYGGEIVELFGQVIQVGATAIR